MLVRLLIKNYALIDNSDIVFNKGLNMITGETGAGKSILMGALGLILGNRVEGKQFFDDSKKCVIEGYFDVSNYQLQAFFVEHDLDYEEETIIRREIAVDGKSRAFVNDSPVTLSILKQLGEKLIDIHSQHATLQITTEDFQLFENYVDQSIVNSALETKNKDIIFFYAYANPEFGFRNSIYYIENLKTIVIAQIDDDILTIFQCYQLEVTELERVISALVTDSINEVRFGFSPIIKDMTLEEYKEEDLTLFVSESLCHLFQNQKLMIPLLSHT